MFRTRDFILVFTIVVFLVMAIGVTFWQSAGSAGAPGNQLTLVNSVATQDGAIADVPEELSRTDRVAQMKAKIAERGEVIGAPETLMPDDEQEVATEVTLATTSEALLSVEQRCALYAAFAGAWPSTEIQFEVVEGSRIVFTEQAAPISTSASTSLIAAVPQRTTYLQLPIRSVPSPAISCVASDVIGVAQDGSLIRNSEVGLYGVFGQDTLIGYALDGFPIYGRSEKSTDSCGGVVEAGQYNYYIAADREVIINCFAAAPAKI